MAREYEIRRVKPPWTSAHQDFAIEERRLNLASVARVNLYALPGPSAFPMAMASLTMMLSALRGKWTGRLRIAEYLIDAPDFQKKPIAEMLGLGITMEVAKTYGWDGRGPEAVDALRQYWGKNKGRPDLLFTRAGSTAQFVGEAKGKTLETVHPKAPHHDERKWLQKLEDWYEEKGLQYFLVVAMASPTRVVANLYDPGEPRPVYPPATLFAAIESRESALWASAPTAATTTVVGQTVRGRWSAVLDDDPDEGGTTYAFLGVLERGLEEPVEVETARWQVSARGRAIVALHLGAEGEGEPPLDAISAFLRTEAEYELRRGGSVIGWGVSQPDGAFVVHAGSQARSPMSSALKSDECLRGDLIRRGVLVEVGSSPSSYFFAEDWRFESPSAAARLVVGSRADGRKEWRRSDGRRLRDLD